MNLTNKKSVQKSAKTTTKVFTGYQPQVFSRHGTHNILRKSLPKLPFKSVVRLGSQTVLEDTVSQGGRRIEINEVKGVRNSSNKLLMKKCFTQAGIKTAPWYTGDSKMNFWINGDKSKVFNIKDFKFPIVAKHNLGSRGSGNYLLKSVEELNRFVTHHDMSNYILENYQNYGLEFRFHTNKNGSFYVCRKALKKDLPENEKWYINDSNCVWFLDTNENFLKPNSYKDIENECVKALSALNLDFAAFDVRVQSGNTKKGKEREYQDFFLVESNSAASFGDITAQKYIEQIPIIAREKAKMYGITK